ncbi:intraflagellar transport protein 20-like protein [Paraphysoderma sedebokerense]|nr:intraflagellar transport protein 20-like protein [Paraphysoderma sedebokerense]
MSLREQPDSQQTITFDEFAKLRILNAQDFESSEKLKEQCRDFTQKITDFSSIVRSFLEILQARSKQIEREKLKAIGQRNRLKNEAGNRRTQQNSQVALIRERQAELDRLTIEYESLSQVEQEQNVFIESLNNK